MGINLTEIYIFVLIPEFRSLGFGIALDLQNGNINCIRLRVADQFVFINLLIYLICKSKNLKYLSMLPDILLK